jgi:hypothetical protein
VSFQINAGVVAFQTMAATKRNAGLTSALPRATLNDEELVSFTTPTPLHHSQYWFYKVMYVI